MGGGWFLNTILGDSGRGLASRFWGSVFHCIVQIMLIYIFLWLYFSKAYNQLNIIFFTHIKDFRRENR